PVPAPPGRRSPRGRRGLRACPRVGGSRPVRAAPARPGPEPTTPAPLPATAVTCTEDRAHVERTATLELRAGTQLLRFGPVSALAVDRTPHTEETRDTTGLTQLAVLTRTVRLRLSRFSAPDERDGRVVVVRERIPVSEVSAVEVRVREEACSPAPDSVDADGVARWDVTLPRGGHRTLTLVHEVSASGKAASERTRVAHPALSARTNDHAVAPLPRPHGERAVRAFT
ncbi:protein of unknown function, partial [Streptomyces sp. di188]